MLLNGILYCHFGILNFVTVPVGFYITCTVPFLGFSTMIPPPPPQTKFHWPDLEVLSPLTQTAPPVCRYFMLAT